MVIRVIIKIRTAFDDVCQNNFSREKQKPDCEGLINEWEMRM